MPARKFDSPPHPFVVRVPQKLFVKINQRARREGKSINDLMVEILTRSMHHCRKKPRATANGS